MVCFASGCMSEVRSSNYDWVILSLRVCATFDRWLDRSSLLLPLAPLACEGKRSTFIFWGHVPETTEKTSRINYSTYLFLHNGLNRPAVDIHRFCNDWINQNQSSLKLTLLRSERHKLSARPVLLFPLPWRRPFQAGRGPGDTDFSACNELDICMMYGLFGFIWDIS